MRRKNNFALVMLVFPPLPKPTLMRGLGNWILFLGILRGVSTVPLQLLYVIRFLAQEHLCAVWTAKKDPVEADSTLVIKIRGAEKDKTLLSVLE